MSGACKLYGFVLGLGRPEKREKITPVMQAKGSPSEKMANFFSRTFMYLVLDSNS